MPEIPFAVAFATILGLANGLAAVRALVTGRVAVGWLSFWGQQLERGQHPVAFWIAVLFHTALALLAGGWLAYYFVFRTA